MARIAEADSQTMRSLKASLIDRGVAKPAGTTWGDFQGAMRDLGVKDSDPLSSIEHGVAAMGSGYLVKEDHGDGVEVREL